MQDVDGHSAEDLLHGIHDNRSDGQGQRGELYQVPEVLEVLEALFAYLVQLTDQEVQSEAQENHLKENDNDPKASHITGQPEHLKHTE